MTAVDVQLHERSYTIEIGTDNLPELGRLAGHWCSLSHAVIVTDSHVEKPHAVAAAGSLSEAGAAVDLLVVEPGELTKSVASAAFLWNKLLDLGADRKSVVYGNW